jgi:hypothetical protein
MKKRQPTYLSTDLRKVIELRGKDFRAIVHLVLDSDANSLKSELVLVKTMAKSVTQAAEKFEAPVEGLTTASDSTLFLNFANAG